MVSYDVQVTGEAMVQPDLPYSNVVFNDLEGILYNPITDGKVIAKFSKTFNPAIGVNFSWDSVRLNWTRYAPSPPLDGFKATFILEGILPNGQIDILAEKIITTIPSISTTEDILFNLKTNRAMAGLSKINVASASAGKVQLNLPKRYFYYESVTLNRVCPEGWTRMAPITFQGPSEDRAGGQLKRIIIPYDSDMKADFSDLRFLDSDGRFFLCFNIDTKINSSYAICTILIPTIYASPAMKTIYMIYGNSSATAITSSFTSAALTSDEPNPYQVEVAVDNFDDASIDANIWTTSIILAQTHIVEHGGYLEIYKDDSTSSPSGFTQDPIIYTPIPGSEDWEIFVKINNTSYTVNSAGGIFLMTSRSSVKQFQIWKYADTGLTYFQTPDGTNTAVTEGAYWMRVRYRGGTYYFAYSANSTDGVNGTWTTLYSTASLGITPTYAGLFGHTWSHNYAANWMFDNFSLKKVLGPESDLSDTSISPETATEDDTTLQFPLPVDWIPASMAFIRFTEIHSTENDTPDIPVAARDIIEKGPDGVDHYAAMRLTGEIEADNTCNVRVNNMRYGFEV